MRKIGFAFTLGFLSFIMFSFTKTSSTGQYLQTKIEWLTWEEAQSKMEKEPRKIVIDVYTEWCGWCKKMDRDTYANPIIANYINNNYHAVKMDGEGSEPITYKDYTFKLQQQGRTKYHELTAALMNGKLSYPTTVILNKEEKLLDMVHMNTIDLKDKFE